MYTKPRLMASVHSQWFQGFLTFLESQRMRLGRKMIVTVKVLFQKAAFYWLKGIAHGTHRRITGGTQEDLR